MPEYDYTAGESVPFGDPDPEDFVIGGTGATTHDAEAIESDNGFSDMEPGDHLLKVVGFGKIEPKDKTGYINGQPVGYRAYQVEVKFADALDPKSRIRDFFLLPPEDPEELATYNDGTNASGGAPGFMAKKFIHFLERLMPGRAYQADGQGGKVMSPYARSLANWKGRLVWAQVEAGKASGKVNPATQEEYPARPQIKLFSFKPYVDGGPSPFAGGRVDPLSSAVKVGTNRVPSRAGHAYI